LANPKSKEFGNQLKSILGKSFDEKEITNLTKLKNEMFQKEIENRFKQKRNERVESLGDERAQEIEKTIFLQTIDVNWKSHIQYLEQLRQVIGLRSYGQRDPLVEYKKEAFGLFENLLNKLKTDLITVLINLTIVQRPVEKIDDSSDKRKIELSKIGKKIGRNDPCFCSSGKKYKHCCGSL